ncbi:uncharacterized protein SETTUDRAFT_31403 [Exserohilum turcica Et28A]|uniref:Uncharacterized protein n=1 Tax=Exserohilum turcicum (strain 28A) TaxID=671987 RepID=R0KGE3_EXST2|nr:uncharacterized protein SETTUDRAFT_31403 [Exserohilum turcica Et28A]EOA87102.1 hypothetical protein SETTUDRAFT_31403 [Exserohilum turcica Et28A]
MARHNTCELANPWIQSVACSFKTDCEPDRKFAMSSVGWIAWVHGRGGNPFSAIFSQPYMHIRISWNWKLVLGAVPRFIARDMLRRTVFRNLRSKAFCYSLAKKLDQQQYMMR